MRFALIRRLRETASEKHLLLLLLLLLLLSLMSLIYIRRMREDEKTQKCKNKLSLQMQQMSMYKNLAVSGGVAGGVPCTL